MMKVKLSVIAKMAGIALAFVLSSFVFPVRTPAATLLPTTLGAPADPPVTADSIPPTTADSTTALYLVAVESVAYRFESRIRVLNGNYRLV